MDFGSAFLILRVSTNSNTSTLRSEAVKDYLELMLGQLDGSLRNAIRVKHSFDIDRKLGEIALLVYLLVYTPPKN